MLQDVVQLVRRGVGVVGDSAMGHTVARHLRTATAKVIRSIGMVFMEGRRHADML